MTSGTTSCRFTVTRVIPPNVRKISHGVYCDEFAEYQLKDMVARQMLAASSRPTG